MSLTAEQALERIFMSDADDLDSGRELNIEEDPAFPLPHGEDGSNSESESDPSSNNSSDDELGASASVVG